MMMAEDLDMTMDNTSAGGSHSSSDNGDNNHHWKKTTSTSTTMMKKVCDESVRTVGTVAESSSTTHFTTTTTTTSPSTTITTGRKKVHDDSEEEEEVVFVQDDDDVEQHPSSKSNTSSSSKYDDDSSTKVVLRFWKLLAMFFAFVSIGFFISTVVLATTTTNNKEEGSSKSKSFTDMSSSSGDTDDDSLLYDLYEHPRTPPGSGSSYGTNNNTCAGSKIDLPNVECIVDEIGEQAGSNVTKGYNGNFDATGTDVVPITQPYYQVGLCPVNVHWHLGSEHYSLGQYDEYGIGPSSSLDPDEEEHHEQEDEDEHHDRRYLYGEGHRVRMGFQCHHYDSSDIKFIKPYHWKHCVDMEVGQTYEVHWPHSAAGACGTLDQYQTPFYDGVFCNLSYETLSTLSRADIANAVGVQSQTFTIVNDETYYYPDLMRGMIVDTESSFGTDLAIYTGSTTGTSRNNEICSQYTPITWQVDRTCHLISASSFDKMCSDMKSQRDDMSNDLYPHGSRELVDDDYAANNHQNKLLLRH